MAWEQGYNAAGVAHLVRTALEKQDLTTAIGLCRELNQQAPEYGPGWHLAAEVALRLGNVASALAMAKRAVACQPDSAAELFIVQCHSMLGQYREGRAAARVLGHGLAPELALKRARLLRSLKCPEDAIGQYQFLIETQGATVALLSELAETLRQSGHPDAAEQALDRAIELEPQQDALWAARAYLRTQTESRHHIDTLQFAIARRNAPCPDLHFALAKEWADLRCDDAAWQHLHTGAGQRQQACRYQADRDLALLRAIAEQWGATPERVTAGPKPGPRPLLLVGLEDGATEALARYLRQHDQIVDLGQHQSFLPELERQLTQRARVGERPLFGIRARLKTAAQLDPELLGRAYLASLPPEAAGAKWVIDRSPGHDHQLGLLLRALPQARAIAPLAPLPLSGAALYQSEPDPAVPYRYDPVQLARYLRGHRQLMTHWQQCHPEQLLSLDLTQSPDAAMAALWHHLALSPVAPPSDWPLVRPWGDTQTQLAGMITTLADSD
ncbi:tetratricopeptide repeat protein [Marinobacter hydrocarbonoclasticus]|nr:tetratricopeptide repeat protein [Marinobacter nauticus]